MKQKGLHLRRNGVRVYLQYPGISPSHLCFSTALSHQTTFFAESETASRLRRSGPRAKTMACHSSHVHVSPGESCVCQKNVGVCRAEASLVAQEHDHGYARGSNGSSLFDTFIAMPCDNTNKCIRLKGSHAQSERSQITLSPLGCAFSNRSALFLRASIL